MTCNVILRFQPGAPVWYILRLFPGLNASYVHIHCKMKIIAKDKSCLYHLTGNVMIWACSCSCLSVYCHLLFFILCTLVILFHASHIPVILPCTHVFSPVTSTSSCPSPMSVLHCLCHGTFRWLTVSGCPALPTSFASFMPFSFTY